MCGGEGKVVVIYVLVGLWVCLAVCMVVTGCGDGCVGVGGCVFGGVEVWVCG